MRSEEIFHVDTLRSSEVTARIASFGLKQMERIGLFCAKTAIGASSPRLHTLTKPSAAPSRE